ncbi:AHH domain-containing protein [Microbulbifer magnicolonia]|uniref:AHH domain-containing protein n=1 Tax=Microbulbifer magnicolonia TaxID=3109744 RepID=UPI003BF590BA
MRADGRPQPNPRFTAHHIVLGKGRTQYAAQSRIDLHFHGIRINDPDNGVWIPGRSKTKGTGPCPTPRRTPRFIRTTMSTGFIPRRTSSPTARYSGPS